METKLTELVTRLKDAASDNLKSVVLYGSAVTGEYTSGHSDLNILCLVQQADSGALEELHPAADWWLRLGNPPPLIFTHEEILHSADVFSIELLDMKMKHRILFGEDFLAALEVPLQLHRLQVERELRTATIRLRQAVLSAPLSNKAHLHIMSSSVSTFCALFRHALFALHLPMPENRRAALDAVANLTGADPTAFREILDLREGKRKPGQIDVEADLHSYLTLVEVVANEFDRRSSS
ncbi:MAG TPA: nucleotidyltransferase domain-containing protein [Verrucomicrobiae bacterium]|nr:nucleotidyltransferase domain-containing protein [Verrucomicrobiae bacterium]